MSARLLRRRAVYSLALYYKGRRGLGALTGRSEDPGKRRPAFYRRIWQEAATAVGCSVAGLGRSMLEIQCEGLRLRIFENYTSLDDPVTLRLAGDKPLVHGLLRDQGVPVPRHLVCGFNELSRARGFVQGLEVPVVVKPARGTGAGRGVTAAARATSGLDRAMALAGAYCSEIVIEEQVEGENYRLLYLDGVLVDAVLRHPPRVTGDGTTTVRQMIAADNRQRRLDDSDIPHSLISVDWELRQTLQAQGLDLRSVPAAGAPVRLKSVVSDNRRDDNVPATDRLCPSIVDSGSAATRALGVRLAGVDVITPDPTQPLELSGGVVIEVNTTPGLHYHYPPPDGVPPIAETLLRRLAGRAS